MVLSDYGSHHTLNFSNVLEGVSKLPQARPYPPLLHHKDFVLNGVKTRLLTKQTVCPMNGITMMLLFSEHTVCLLRKFILTLFYLIRFENKLTSFSAGVSKNIFS